MPNNPPQAFTVVFLNSSIAPDHFLLLKRSADRHFAPGWYTGIGGKVELEESPSQAAYRELKEEAGIEDIHLQEFAQVIVNKHKALHYYFGSLATLKVPACNEGELEWIIQEHLLEKPIIPTTQLFLQEWIKRDFSTTKPWTMWMEGASDPTGLTKNPQITIVKEGLEV